MIKQLLLSFLSAALLCALEPIVPLPTKLKDVDLAKAKLGRMLFFDPILSSDRTVSCLSCHSFDHGGADPLAVSIGVHDRKGGIQSPSVYNARYNFRQFWNGRAGTLSAQLGGPLYDHAEMDMTPQQIETRLNQSPLYLAAFEKIYGFKPITIDDVTDAIVEFEKALVTPNSRFDRYLRGEIELSDAEQKGYEKFKTLGCVTCHNGINIGANAYQKMGLFRDYTYDPKYQDRFALTKSALHKNVFKVPTLRNITFTAPYFHDASAATLDEAIITMARYNLGITISKEDRDLLIIFLKSLEGDRPKILDMP